MSRRTGVAVGLAALTATGLALWSLFSRDPSLPTGRPMRAVEGTATLKLDFGDGKIREFNDVRLPGNGSVFDLLFETAEKEGLAVESRGSFVTRIGAARNGEGDRYWQYWVNGKYAPVGAKAFILRPADRVEWRFAGEGTHEK